MVNFELTFQMEKGVNFELTFQIEKGVIPFLHELRIKKNLTSQPPKVQSFVCDKMYNIFFNLRLFFGILGFSSLH